MSQFAIVAENLTYTYGELTAVDHINFQVEEGQILGFLGPNGAGKSTTVKMLTGQLRPKAGKATLLGIDVVQHPKAIHSQIGVAFEATNLYEQMTALENLQLFARIFDVKNFDGMKMLEQVGLAERAKERVAKYSKGMKQRLMVARALINKPRILFLDEPTDGLDPVSSESIRQLILSEREARGATVFLTTHDMYEADKLSDHVAFINAGEIVALDTPRNLKQQYGKRALKVELRGTNGAVETREFDMNDAAGAAVSELLATGDVVTIHSEEATLEDIFIKITGRGLLA